MTETEVRIKHGKVYKRILAAIKSGEKIIINKGGTGSAKTYDIMNYIVGIGLSQTDKIITVVSESVPHLEIGVIRIFEAIMKKAELYNADNWNSTQKRYTFESGTILEFFSADRIGKALGARRYMLYGNEINNLKFEVFDELSRRSEIILADFNPTAEFWLEKFIEFYGGVIIKSNYLDNPFLPEFEKQRIIKRASMDSNFKRIHIDAEYGNYEGLVFTDWKLCEKIPSGATLLGYGLDFGFTNDPSSLIGIYKYQSEHYCDEVIYQTGLLSADFLRLMKQKNVSTTKPIYADNAEPRVIRELQLGGYNVKGLKKEKIYERIEFTKKYFKFVTQTSTNLIKELRNYMWINKDGKFINEPIDLWNHAIDAKGYGFVGIYSKSNLTMF